MSYVYKKDFFRRICVRDLNPRNLFAMVYDNCLLITGFEISGLNRQIAFLSIVFGVKLKETLRMITGRTNIRGLSADDDMTAVTAFPNFDLALFKYPSGFDIFEQCAVSFFMVLFNFGDQSELCGKLREALRLGGLGKAFIHIRPLVVLAFSSCF